MADLLCNLGHVTSPLYVSISPTPLVCLVYLDCYPFGAWTVFYCVYRMPNGAPISAGASRCSRNTNNDDLMKGAVKMQRIMILLLLKCILKMWLPQRLTNFPNG